MKKPAKLTPKKQLRAIWGVAVLSFKAAPGAVIFKLLGSVVNALLPIATTYFAALTTTTLADAYNGNTDAQSQVILYVILTAVFGLVMIVWNSVDNYVQTKMRYVVGTRVSNRMLEHFLTLDFWRYDDKHTADLYDRSQRFVQFFSWIFDRIASIISQLIGVFSAIIALAFVNGWLAFFVLMALMPGVYVQFRLSRQQIQHWNKNVDVRRSLNLIEWNMLQPKLISELRLYGMVDYLMRLLTTLRDKDEKQRIEIERRATPLTLLSNVLESAAEVGALIWISLQIMARSQPLGQFVYVQQIVSRAISSVNALVSIISSIDEDIANLFDYEEFMHLPTQKRGTRKLQQPPEEIAFENVSFHYPGSDARDVLHGINLRIKRNEHVAIVGENGAGKTTLIKLLTGLYAPTSGQLHIDAIPLADIDIATWHKHLGVLQQEFIHYGFATARENVRFGDIEAPYHKARLTQALHDAEAYDFVEKLPKGLDSYINNWMEDDDGNQGIDLSGGQWQRLALARDFYRNAPIVILDEPTSAIDALAEARIFKRLFESHKRTVITISHRLSTIKKADIIYMLKDGRVVESGTHDELIAKKGHFYKMFEAQISGS